MKVKTVALNKAYSFLADSDAYVTVCLQNQFAEGDCSGGGKVISGKRPALVVCPGGAYSRVSSREGEPAALAFAPLGFNLFVLQYCGSPETLQSRTADMAAARSMSEAVEKP